MTLPQFQSKLSMPMQPNNFVPMQSVQLTVSNAGASGSQSKTFTILPGTARVTFKITNAGTKGAYLATGTTTATAVVSSGTVTPTASSSATTVATCDYIAAGAIITQDYIHGTDTIAAICSGSDTTTLEVTIGSGQ